MTMEGLLKLDGYFMLDNSYFFSLGPFHLRSIWGKYFVI